MRQRDGPNTLSPIDVTSMPELVWTWMTTVVKIREATFRELIIDII